MSSLILLAEDEFAIRVMLATMLEKAGHCVEVAEDGRDALRMVQAKLFDLVISDQLMHATGEQLALMVQRLSSGTPRDPADRAQHG